MRLQFRTPRWLSLSLSCCACAPIVIAGLFACSATHFDGTTYRHGDIAFSIPNAPSHWRRLDVSNALFSFRDDAAHATIAVHGRCGKDGDDIPLESLTQHLFIYFTEREVIDQKRMALDGREAMRTEMLAKLDGVPRRFVVVVLKKDGCVYDFLYVSEVNGGDQSVSAFDRYVASFHTVQP